MIRSKRRGFRRFLSRSSSTLTDQESRSWSQRQLNILGSLQPSPRLSGSRWRALMYHTPWDLQLERTPLWEAGNGRESGKGDAALQGQVRHGVFLVLSHRASNRYNAGKLARIAGNRRAADSADGWRMQSQRTDVSAKLVDSGCETAGPDLQ